MPRVCFTILNIRKVFIFVLFQQMPYYVHIARFMPHVEIVQNHTSTVRRLFIRGDNGKVNLLYHIAGNFQMT